MKIFSTKNIKSLTINNIYDNISDYDIFNYYIKNIVFNKAFSSPLRDDYTPSFALSRKNQKIVFKDFASGAGGGAVDFVMLKFNASFKEALLIINTDFNLGLAEPLSAPSMSYYGVHDKTFNVKEINSEIKHIDVIIRDYNLTDKSYWFDKYNINIQILKKYKVIPIQKLFINGRLVKTYSSNNPIYGFYFGENKWKIYSPYDAKFKWLSNCSELQGFKQLPKTANILIIQKSLKDAMVMSSLGYYSFAPHAESVIIDNDLMDKLKRRFKKIYIFYDFDYAGIVSSMTMQRKYGLYPIFLNNGNLGPYNWNAKDISDFIELYKVEKTIDFLQKRIKIKL